MRFANYSSAQDIDVTVPKKLIVLVINISKIYRNLSNISNISCNNDINSDILVLFTVDSIIVKESLKKEIIVSCMGFGIC